MQKHTTNVLDIDELGIFLRACKVFHDKHTHITHPESEPAGEHVITIYTSPARMKAP